MEKEKILQLVATALGDTRQAQEHIAISRPRPRE